MVSDVQNKWDKAAITFDFMAANGTERRWAGVKKSFFRRMDGEVLFLALGTGLDITAFPTGKRITTIDVSPEMIIRAQSRLESYDGQISAEVMDVEELSFADNTFDQVFTSCTFCSVPDPVRGLKSLKRVLKREGELYMFEHTGSRYFPLSFMMRAMTLVSKPFGPEMDRPTTEYVKQAGFVIEDVQNLYLDVLKIITARHPRN